MKKSLFLSGTILFLIILIQISSPKVVSDAEIPEWIVGDSWNYHSSIEGSLANFTIEVTEITAINVNGTDYEVYVAETTIELPIEQKIITSTIKNYILKDDLSTVKTELIETGPNESLRITVTTYDPPKKDYDFPLEVGKEWISHFFESIYEEELGYSNITRQYKYKVVGEESITVEAGTFDCYKIEVDIGFGNPTITWYSPKVNNVVLTTGRQEEMGLPIELTHHAHGDKDDGETSFFKVPYLLLLLLIPIIVILFVGILVMRKSRKKKKRKKKRKKKKKKK